MKELTSVKPRFKSGLTLSGPKNVTTRNAKDSSFIGCLSLPSEEISLATLMQKVNEYAKEIAFCFMDNQIISFPGYGFGDHKQVPNDSMS